MRLASSKSSFRRVGGVLCAVGLHGRLFASSCGASFSRLRAHLVGDNKSSRGSDVIIVMNRIAPLMPALSVHHTYKTNCVMRQMYPVSNVNSPVGSSAKESHGTIEVRDAQCHITHLQDCRPPLNLVSSLLLPSSYMLSLRLFSPEAMHLEALSVTDPSSSVRSKELIVAPRLRNKAR